jgi:hypothetical protein
MAADRIDNGIGKSNWTYGAEILLCMPDSRNPLRSRGSAERKSAAGPAEGSLSATSIENGTASGFLLRTANGATNRKSMADSNCTLFEATTF